MLFNKKMEKLILNSSKNIRKIKVDLKKLFNVLFPKFKNIFGCVIIDYKEILDEKNIDFDNIISMYYDKTGYEASCNEIRLNDFITNINKKNVFKISKIIMDSWKNKLKSEFPEENFEIILSIKKKNATLRFHKIRNNESRWLADDLEKYSEAIMRLEIINNNNYVRKDENN